LSGVACVDNAVAAYLRHGTVPERKPGRRSDLRCSPLPAPDPTAAAAPRQELAPLAPTADPLHPWWPVR
jgi:hypothetical protein